MAQSSPVHIADIDFAAFYAPILGSLEASTRFYQTVAAPNVSHDAKIILHQAARMVWLGDRIEEVAAGRPAFQVLFYLTAAELVAKIVSGFEGEGESKRHVRKFFCEICELPQRGRLGRAFRRVGGTFLTLEATVDYLYAIRCDVVHRGQYYTFNLRTGGIPLLTGNGNNDVITEISLPELRQIVLAGAVLAARQVAGI